jgi:hypothetical protein
MTVAQFNEGQMSIAKLLMKAAWLLVAMTCIARAEVPPGAPSTPYIDPAKAYLFAHMTKAQYGISPTSRTSLVSRTLCRESARPSFTTTHPRRSSS